MSDRTILHIDLDAFFASVEVVLNPVLKGKPIIVGGKPNQRGVVATASYEARTFGVHSAMPLVTAHKLCPQGIFISGNFNQYREFSRKFMAILNDFSPFIQPMGIDEAYLDVSGFESLHGSIHQMAAKMKQRIKSELGLCASVGIATCKVVAKVASDLSKPDGLIEVAPGKEHTFLAPLSIEKLPGIGKQRLKIITSLGIHTIGELAQVPAQTMQLRLGSAGELLHNYANGIDDREVLPPGEAKSISRETTFQVDTQDRQLLERILWKQSEKIGATLRRESKQAKCVTLKLRYADFSTITRSCTLRESIDIDRVIFEAGMKLLEQPLAKNNQTIRLIGIGVTNIMEMSRQETLFTPSTRKLEKLYQAIDRIRARYGFDAIKTGTSITPEDV